MIVRKTTILSELDRWKLEDENITFNASRMTVVAGLFVFTFALMAVAAISISKCELPLREETLRQNEMKDTEIQEILGKYGVSIGEQEIIRKYANRNRRKLVSKYLNEKFQRFALRFRDVMGIPVFLFLRFIDNRHNWLRKSIIHSIDNYKTTSLRLTSKKSIKE